MNELINNDTNEFGSVKISEDVVATIAGIAASEIEGVAGMSGGITGGIADILGMKNTSKGVKVEVGDKQAAIDLYIIVDYGTKIKELGEKIQENVKKTVETMTGLEVVEVNVFVQGVNFAKKTDPEDEPRVK